MEKFIKEAFNLFDQIGSTTSRNDKEAYLEQGKNNPVFKELLFRCYNPFLMFNVKKVNITTAIADMESADRYVQFKGLLDMLNKRSLTGNAASTSVSSLFNVCNVEEQKWYVKVLQKDLKIGITESTINKVFGKDFIPTYSCMLAHPFKKYPRRSIVQPKLDGYRCNAFRYNDDTVVLRTRNGNIIEGYTQIEKEIVHLIPKGYMADGEIMGRDGKFNTVQSAVFKKGAKDKDGVLVLFDIISIREFESGKGITTYVNRIDHLDLIAEEIEAEKEWVTSVAVLEYAGIYNGEAEKDQETIAQWQVQYVKEGYEGTMLKDVDAVYECKRTYSVQKIKDMDTLDLVVIDVEEGKAGTKNEGTLGALVVDFNGNHVNVGSGYSDELRAEIWATRTDIINRTIEVKYQEITKNKQGTESLRFPVFMRIRDDK